MNIAAQSLKDYIIENYSEDGDIEVIAEHGCASAISGMIYFHETIGLYNRFERDLWETLGQLANEISDGNVLKMMGEGEYGKLIADNDSFKNYMVWAAVEEICMQLVLEREDMRASAGGAK